MGSLAALAETPMRIFTMLDGNGTDKNHFYKIWLYVLGDKIPVTVDDHIPTYEWGAPALCHSKHEEAWVAMVEKAFAKLHLRYDCIDGGQ